MTKAKTPKNKLIQTQDVLLGEIISCLDKKRMKVGNKSNLINYLQLKEIFRKKFKARDAEINFWIRKSDHKILCPLHGEVMFEYAQCYEKKDEFSYATAFFYQIQVQNFEPESRFMNYDEVKNVFKKSVRDYRIEDEDILQLMMNELCAEDFNKFWRASDGDINMPIIEGKIGFFYERKKDFTAEQLRKRLKALTGFFNEFF